MQGERPASRVGDEDGGDEEDQGGRQPKIDDAPDGEGEPCQGCKFTFTVFRGDFKEDNFDAPYMEKMSQKRVQIYQKNGNYMVRPSFTCRGDEQLELV